MLMKKREECHLKHKLNIETITELEGRSGENIQNTI